MRARDRRRPLLSTVMLAVAWLVVGMLVLAGAVALHPPLGPIYRGGVAVEATR